MSCIEIPVEGMKCTNCVHSVTAALVAVRGVRAAEVSLERRSAEVQFDGALVSPRTLTAAVEAAGFRVPDRGDAQVQPIVVPLRRARRQRLPRPANGRRLSGGTD